MGIELKEYLSEAGYSPFQKWFDGLNTEAAAKVTVALTRLSLGNFSFGPGYRIYFGRQGETIVILLHGGSKKGQSKDIQKAKNMWSDFKQRSRRGEM